jgi:hypothetical protein
VRSYDRHLDIEDPEHPKETNAAPSSSPQTVSLNTGRRSSTMTVRSPRKPFVVKQIIASQRTRTDAVTTDELGNDVQLFQFTQHRFQKNASRLAGERRRKK